MKAECYITSSSHIVLLANVTRLINSVVLLFISINHRAKENEQYPLHSLTFEMSTNWCCFGLPWTGQYVTHLNISFNFNIWFKVKSIVLTTLKCRKNKFALLHAFFCNRYCDAGGDEDKDTVTICFPPCLLQAFLFRSSSCVFRSMTNDCISSYCYIGRQKQMQT